MKLSLHVYFFISAVLKWRISSSIFCYVCTHTRKLYTLKITRIFARKQTLFLEVSWSFQNDWFPSMCIVLAFPVIFFCILSNFFNYFYTSRRTLFLIILSKFSWKSKVSSKFMDKSLWRKLLNVQDVFP